MDVFVTVGFRKLKGIIVEEVDDKYVVELEDKSRVVVNKNQIERG